jgi:MinD superfamily P-loop ATPase
MMFRVSKDLCAGCGLCVESCQRGAILIESGKAWINQTGCNGCGNCFDVCPQGAIVENVPVSENDLAIMIVSLKQKADDLLGRIEKLGQQRATIKEKKVEDLP